MLAFVLDVMNLVDLDDKSEHSRYFTLHVGCGHFNQHVVNR